MSARAEDWVELCGSEAVREGRACLVEAAGLRLAVFRWQGTHHVLTNACPHAGGSLAGGWVEDGEAVCPLHRWRFRLIDGRNPEIRGSSVSCFPCEVRDGRIWARLPLV